MGASRFACRFACPGGSRSVNQMNLVPPHLPPMPAPVLFSGNRGEFFRLVTRGAGLELITVGFYRFWLATDIRRHLWSNTHIDGDSAEYTGRGRELLIGFLIALAILVPIYLAYFLVGLEAERYKAFASIPLFLFFYLFGQFAIYRARRYRLTRTVWRWWLSGIRFGDVRLESTMRRGALIGLYWKVIGWVLVLAVVFAAYLAACSGLVASMSGMPISQFFAPQVLLKSVPLLILAGLGYLVFALALNVVMRVYLLRDLWVGALASTIVHDIEAAANVSARGEMANALGEGFADGLDVAGF